MSEDPQKIANSGGTSPVDFKAMFAELLDDAKRDILAHVQDSIEKVYADFEDYETVPETGEASTECSDTAVATTVATKINDFIQPKTSDHAEGSDGGSFKSLADEFSVLEKTSPAIDANLAEIVESLLTEKLTKETLAEIQNKYLRPENCTNLVAPKINKQIWPQLRQETRNNDSAFQKAQSLLLSGLYAVLQLCNSANGDQRNVLTHTAVLLLSANRELNLKRRDLIRPDLNKQYAPLCNPSTAVSTFLFGDDLNKEVEELTKSQKLSNKVTPKRRMEPYKVTAFRGVRGRGRFGQSTGRGRASSNSFLGQGRGYARPQQNPRSSATKTQ